MKQIPGWFTSLLSVEKLSFRNNRLVKVTPDLAKLKSVTALDAGGNLLKEFPAVLCKMHHVRHVVLDNNQIASIIPEVEQLAASLETLDLACNHLQEIPAFIYDFGVLAVLDVSGNKIAKLQQALGKLVSLNSLSFADNLLDELPVELGLLTNLEHLTWRGNRLRAPPEICDGLFSVRTPTVNPRGADRTIKYFERLYKASTRHMLMLDGFGLSTFPHELMLISTLTELSLKGNALKKLPPNIGGLVYLKKLNLENNELEALHPSLGKLTHL
ncbi:hypothetical protein T484DRAFT_1792182, partial [Baffinella frigidus]